ncbi:MAG: hypothetical protein Q8L05_11255 [Actinomycetota bacterium]|nr:hypothetical protein [Actinomycetota bacterium]MDP2289440.1 hypothetical protein [Actinomycetota bacterium]
MIIPERFRGPRDAAHGGYACGVYSSLLDGPAEVTLRNRTPLNTALEVQEFEDGVRVMQGEDVLAVVAPATLELDVLAPVSVDAASAAMAGFPWYEKHPSDGECFACGPGRAIGDGLRIFPGPVAGREVVAAPWTPTASDADADGTVLSEMLIATLDCTAFLGGVCFDPGGGPSLLGRLRSEVFHQPQLGQTCVSVGWFLGRDGRKLDVGSALFNEKGDLLALGRATWIELRSA